MAGRKELSLVDFDEVPPVGSDLSVGRFGVGQVL